MAPSVEEMRQRLSQETVGWNPEEGAEVFGKVVGLSEGQGDWEPYPIVEVDDMDTKQVIAVHAFHTVLKGQLAEKKPKVGDTIGIKYFGKRTPRNGGNPYENYKVDVYPADESDAATPDWNAHAESAKAEQAGTGDEYVDQSNGADPDTYEGRDTEEDF